MGRCGLVCSVVLAIALIAILTGCLGKSTPTEANGGVKSISLSPSGSVSLEVGSNVIFTASAASPNGRAVPGVDISYVVSSPAGVTIPPPLSITSSGNACAGTWDASGALCNAGSTGVAVVTAVANGVQSTPTTVYVHQHIDQLLLKNLQTTTNPSSCYVLGPCCSQGQTWLYQGLAYNNGVDITNTVGPITWTSTNTGVLKTNATASVTPALQSNQVQIQGSAPGITELYASVGGTTSNSLPITTCLIASLKLQIQGSTANFTTVDNGSTVALQATAIDTLGYTITAPPLTWSTSDPEVVSFSTAQNTTGTNTATAHNNLGGAAVTVACTPPTCNIGVLPGVTVPTSPGSPGSPTGPGAPDPNAMPVYVFSSDGPISSVNPLPGYGAISIDVTTTGTIPTYTGYAATTLCGDTTNGCTSVLFSAIPTTGGANPVQASISVPRTPNSMLFNHQSRVYMGSNLGLMYSDVGGSNATVAEVSPAPTPCNVALCGTVLTISNDGKQVVVFDNTIPATPQLYIYNTSASPATTTDLIVPPNVVISAASFSPDESKVFATATDGTLYVYSTVNAFQPQPTTIPAPTSIAFSGDGSFAYVGGGTTTSGGGSTNSVISAFSTCALTGVPSSPLTSAAIAGVPLNIFPSPVIQHDPSTDILSQNIYVLEPPNIQVLTANFKQNAIGDGQSYPISPFTCTPPTVDFSSVAPVYNLGQGNFTPVYAELAANGAEIIIVARFIPAVLIFDVSNGTTRAVPLVNSLDPQSASASSDGSQVYVGACDQYVANTNPPNSVCASGSLHIVNTFTNFDQQAPYINNTTNNMCSGLGPNAPVCYPNLVAIKPQ